MAQHTPMMKQYLDIKAQYQDAFLFFRLGDFYEMFYEDAEKAARELEITLTGRGQGEDRIPMCGVPHHSANQYMTRLIEKGYKIAICDQVEDPKLAKGVVKREVVKLLTPGTIMDGSMLQEKENNYLCSVSQFEDGSFGVARSDLTTGENAVTLVSDIQEVIQEVAASGSKELVISSDFNAVILAQVQASLKLTISYEDELELSSTYDTICARLEQQKLKKTFSRLLNYLMKTQKRSLDHLQAVDYYSADSYLKIDLHSKRNLELTETLREKKKQGSLLSILDDTVTAMGGRLLKKWVERPLVNQIEIEERLTNVDIFLSHFFEREELRDQLRHVYDLERLAGRISYGSVNARELVQLKRSLQRMPAIISQLKQMDPHFQGKWFSSEYSYEELIDLLERSILDDPPISVKDGGMIRDGFNEELDTYRDASVNGKKWIAALERKEREETGIKSLKIGYNKVFGYYIEVTRANIANLPEGRYERKQTLTNAERYVTPELKEKEAIILEAEEKMEQLEYDLFVSIREQVKEYVHDLQQLAHTLSEIDVLAGFAAVSDHHHYVKPSFSAERTIAVKAGRHPVVETMINKGDYVANDVHMNDGRSMLLITGPNMAGKSTYMRQLALISVMAQTGCFVPASEAKLPIFDQVFTRIGAADDLASGQSTFMVEMLETKYALTKATQNSLILLDEIGRGTSTYDGMALAQAIIEFIHDKVKAKTLFSTHYHELTSLENDLFDLKNVHVSAIEEDGKVVFLHKVIDGQADRSYGIYVAELAELPKQVTDRAEQLLEQFEETAVKTRTKQEPVSEDILQLSLFAEDEPPIKEKPQLSKQHEKHIIEKLKQTDVLNLTPIAAIQLINEWQQRLR
ncbi:DNA mismatch repair protein MutS [Bacillus solitudinis]|uniref:DNA mismatch repair protein MutS n=1 Tax=Bacillus solitudinis TaxID=2014074 RepID=UPI000C2339E6|nr:DNA mismatch repair protein MutS [Bacillus solitudinis]